MVRSFTYAAWSEAMESTADAILRSPVVPSRDEPTEPLTRRLCMQSEPASFPRCAQVRPRCGDAMRCELACRRREISAGELHIDHGAPEAEVGHRTGSAPSTVPCTEGATPK